jgi:CRP-like cAMP-binding protein
MKDSPDVKVHNQILSALGAEEMERLKPHLRYSTVSNGEMLYRANEPIEFLYFPNYSMVSVVGSTAQGSSAEIGVIGYEGVAGVDALLGAGTAINNTMIQLPNGGYRLATGEGLREFHLGGSFQRHVLLFLHKLLTQVSQTAVCNRLHGLEERLARWLLMCSDRTQDDTLRLTQEFLALMVGTTRASVTLAAIDLQDLGFITYSRGKIKILDPDGMLDFSCDCCKIVRSAYAKQPDQSNSE